MAHSPTQQDLLSELVSLRQKLARLEPGPPEARPLGMSDQCHALFEQSADAILIIEGETFVDCNRATVDMLRYRDKAELLRTHPSELSPSHQPDGRDSFEKANEMIAMAIASGSHRFEWDHKRADGEVFPVEVLLTAVPHGETSILHVVWRDLTERKQLEDQLRQSQKMEAIGKLAGGIAHDFNNLLVAINGNAELISEVCAGMSEVTDLADEISKAGARAADLTRQLLTFSRKQVLRPLVVDMNQILANVTKLLGRLISEDVTLITKTCPETLPVMADPGQLEQVLINLVTNARDAMPSGGTLTVSTSMRTVERSDQPAQLELPPGDYALLTVRDTGTGMSTDVLRQAFDPFFTTKPPGEGTGLGLSTVYGIVKNGQGDVTIHSQQGQGTAIEVLYPLTSEQPAQSAAPESRPIAGSRPATVLVVEDEAAVAKLLERLLHREGHTVLLASNGIEALTIFSERPQTIDLIITDVVMPHLGGPDMVGALRDRGLTPRVLFASGYANRTRGGQDELPPDAAFIQKPYSPHELLERVRGLLEERG